MNQTRRHLKIPKGNQQIVTALLAGCLLFAYWFLFFDNNAMLEEDIISKMAAVIYPVALLMAIFLLKSFNKKSAVLLVCLFIYLMINYCVFKKGLRVDLTVLFVVMSLFVMGKIKMDYSCVKSLLWLEFILFLAVLVSGHFENGYYVSEIFNDMFINSNTMSQLVMVNMFVAIILSEFKKHTAIYLIVYIVGLFLLYLCESRTAMVCGLIMCVGHFFSKRMKSSTVYKLFIVALFVSVIFVLVYAYLLPLVVPKDYVIFGKRLFTGRQRIYVTVLEYIFDSPLTTVFGYGFVTFGQNSGAYLNSHNFWLQLWLQYGFVLMLIIFVLFVNVARNFSRRNNNMSKLQIIYLTCLVVLCMLECPLTGRTMSVLLLFPIIIGGSVVGRRHVKKTAIDDKCLLRYRAGYSSI